jgi:hypothetical protein
MADTPRKMLDILGTMFADGQAANSLTPQKFRDVVETLKTQYCVSATAASATFTTAAVSTWKALDTADSLLASNGFSRTSAGIYQYDAPPVDSVTLSNGVRSFLALGIATVEPLAANEEFSFGFAVDGTIATNTVTSQNLISLVLPSNIVFGGLLVDLANGESVTAQARNNTAGNNLTVESLTTILIGLND